MSVNVIHCSVVILFGIQRNLFLSILLRKLLKRLSSNDIVYQLLSELYLLYSLKVNSICRKTEDLHCGV
jgi:hypothetical protein